jgi:hypothetical protein
VNRALLVLLLCGVLRAQSLQGVFDIHAHCDPDVVPRSIDALNLVRLAKQKGFRGLVLKNHYEPTASWAALARQEVPGVEVFGGIVLNRAVGGVNPAAVERMANVKGNYGRVVWMPTFDSENHVRVTKESRPFVSVSRNGSLLPEVLQVFEIIAKRNLVLATGHSTPAEVLMMIREAKKRGVNSIVVTHAMIKYVAMSPQQIQEAARLGVMVEFVANGILGLNKEFEARTYASTMKQTGWDSVILSSDFGQQGNPLHPDGLEQVFRLLRAEGVTEEQLNRAIKHNPARLLSISR